MNWHTKKEVPREGERLLVFSPAYPKGHEMRYRLVNSQFLKAMSEVTLWGYLSEFDFDLEYIAKVQ